ncbi:Oxidoreductase aldo/keto reductase family protein [Trichostrongylus colubriformis]|uniref:Oxidoreductase aldo/keto reductase family protein n=1 Tax=Trichostrongylus colubriformis TaxID=6319 RepID=A0AAN8IAA2_TRICO
MLVCPWISRISKLTFNFECTAAGEHCSCACAMNSVVGGTAKLNTGYDIPLLGLGTYKVTGTEVKPTVDKALAFGFRLFDTAKYYVNEPELGTALEELLPKHKLTRDDIFLTTKFHMNPEDPAGGARSLVMESLERLKTSYLDMVMIHYPKALRSDEKDEKNKLHRKLTYMELEKLKSRCRFSSALAMRGRGVVSYKKLRIYAFEGEGDL